ncbi:hypothetical protein A2U01_0108346, partial [Trifolium medium]|nr:hypothetical protein [Trifolium medium]
MPPRRAPAVPETEDDR